MLEISIDRDTCCGYGNCVVVAPEVFDLDEEDTAVLLAGHPLDDDEAVVVEAAADCPVRAIRLGAAKS